MEMESLTLAMLFAKVGLFGDIETLGMQVADISVHFSASVLLI